jgi:chemotaxis signal transduction protein
MQVALWTAADERYALPLDMLVEVVPVVSAQPVPGAPAWIKGIMNHRGSLIPLIDASLLLGERTVPTTMAHRILVLRIDEASGTDVPALVGLLVTGFDDIVAMDAAGDGGHPGLATGSDHLAGMIVHDGAQVQCIDPTGLLDDDQRHVLFGRIEEARR